MTIIEIKNQIIGHFYDKNTFSLDSDSDQIDVGDELKKLKQEVVRSVLGELELIGMVKKVAGANDEVWILTQSFETFSQSVVISAPVGEAICETIDGFREANDIGGDCPDKTKITEADIMNLVNIIQVLLQEGTDPEEEDDEDESD